MEYVLVLHTLFCRYIHFVFEFCDTRTWYVMLFLLLWILGGLAAILYCLISSTGTEGRLEAGTKNIVFFSPDGGLHPDGEEQQHCDDGDLE